SSTAFVQIRDHMEAEHAQAFEYFNLPAMLPQAYSNMLSLQGYANFSQLAGVDMPPMILPPLHQLAPAVTPAAIASTTSSQGLRFSLHSPFPGSLAIYVMHGLSIQKTAMMVGILLPAVASARRAAQAMTSNT